MHELIEGYPRYGSLLSTSSSLRQAHAAWCAQKREAKGLSSRLRASFAEATGERRGVAPGSFVDLLVNATDKATGESLSDLERTNQAFVMVMSGGRAASCCVLTHALQRCMLMQPTRCNDVVNATRRPGRACPTWSAPTRPLSWSCPVSVSQQQGACLPSVFTNRLPRLTASTA